MNKRDYYEVLGISKTSSPAEIKSAFRKLAKQHHPDINKEPGTEEKFKEIQEAYAVLSDDTKRKQYDQFGHTAPGGGAGFNSGGFDFSGFDFSDIINEAFGGGFGGFNNRNSSTKARKGQDRLYKMKLDFMDAVKGTSKEIELDVYEECSTCNGKGGHGEESCSKCHGTGTVTMEQRTLFGNFLSKTTCPNCDGHGVIYKQSCSDCGGNGKLKIKKKITVTVPAGVDNDNQLRLANKGEAGYNGGPNGDLYIEFIVMPHKVYKRDDRDVYIEIPINITEAILGCKKEVPTLDSTVILNIPAGSKTGDKHKLKQKGIPDVNNKRKGDLYIVLKVIIPERITKEQKKIIDELAKTNLNDNSEIKKMDEFIKSMKNS